MTPPAQSATAEAKTTAPVLGGRSGHNPVLDGVRGLAILLVMAHHFTVFNPANKVEEYLHSALTLGTTGVTLFFVLSGFLITGILLDSKGAPNFFRNFYARRTVRIFPLYYAVVFLSLVVIPIIIPKVMGYVASPTHTATLSEKLSRFGQVQGYEWWFWLYLCNVPMAELGKFMHGILGVCWSLAIEEQFYMVWPLVVYLCSKRALARVCVGLIIGALVLRVVMVYMFHHSGTDIFKPLAYANPVGIYVLTPCRIDALALGALMAVVARGSFDLSRLLPLAKVVAICGVPLMFAVRFVEKRYGIGYPELGGLGWLETTVGFSLDLTVYGAVILLAIYGRSGGVWHWLWTNPFMAALGKYSYAIYLFHVPLRALIRDVVYGPALINGVPSGAKFKFFTIAGSELPGQVIFALAALVISMAAAWLSWHVFEKHCLKLKRFFPSGAERR